MINDDKPFLQVRSSGVVAYGSPWSGKHGLDSNICVPLKGICLLHRGKENVIERIDPKCMIGILRHQAHIPADNTMLDLLFSLVDDLAQNVPLWEMYCNKDVDAARVSYQAMSSARI